MLVLLRYTSAGHAEPEDLTPSQEFKPPVMPTPISGEADPVLTVIEYLIDPVHAREFKWVMEETRSARLRQGALSCELFRDATQPGRYVEHILDETWTEHLRRFDRVIAHDVPCGIDD